MEIKIADLLPPEHIILDISAQDKTEVIKEMIGVLEENGEVLDREAFFNCLMEREELETTGIGDGVALPHGRTDAVRDMLMVFARSQKGIDFAALDTKPVYLLVLIAAPKKESTRVLKLLAKVSRLLNNARFREALRSAKSKEELMGLFGQQE